MTGRAGNDTSAKVNVHHVYYTAVPKLTLFQTFNDPKEHLKSGIDGGFFDGPIDPSREGELKFIGSTTGVIASWGSNGSAVFRGGKGGDEIRRLP